MDNANDKIESPKQEELVYDVLPIFEKDKSDRLMREHYSFRNNQCLLQSWQKYKDNYSNKIFAPFQFPDVRDYHFYNQTNRLIPEQTILKRAEYKMKLRPGPGVDFQGQMPIPNEMLVRGGREKNPLNEKRSHLKKKCA